MREIWDKYKRFTHWGILGIIAILSLIFFIISINYSEQRVKIVKQKDYLSGTKALVSVEMLSNPIFGDSGSFFGGYKPVVDAGGALLAGKVKFELLDKNKKSIIVLSDWSKEDTLTHNVSIEIPKGIEGEHFLKVYASSQKGKDTIFEKINIIKVRDERRLSLHTDKSLYKPGDEVSFRALLTQKSDDTPVKSNIKILITDGNKNTVYNEDLLSSENGIIGAKFKLANKVNSGSYTLKAEAGTCSSEINFEVKPYVLPKFKLDITTDKKEYALNEDIVVTVTGSYFFGEAVKGGKGSVKLGEDSKEINLDDKGQGKVIFKGEKEGKYDFSATITDLSNYQVNQSTFCYVQKDGIQVSFVPENSKLLLGVDNIVYIFTKNIDESPVKAYLTLNGPVRKEFVTDSNGMAKFNFTPNASDVTFDVLVTDEKSGVRFNKNINLPVAPQNTGLLIRTDKLIYNQGEKINTTIVSGIDRLETKVFAVQDDVILNAFSTKESKVEWDFPKDTYGIIDIYAQNANNPDNINNSDNPNKNVFSKKSILIKSDKKMLLNIDMENKTYKPGEEVNLSIEMKNGSNRLLNGAVGVSILDEAVLSLGDNDFSVKEPLLTSIDRDFNYMNMSSYANIEKINSYGNKAKICFNIAIIILLVILAIKYTVFGMEVLYMTCSATIFTSFAYIKRNSYAILPNNLSFINDGSIFSFIFGIAIPTLFIIILIKQTYPIFKGEDNKKATSREITSMIVFIMAFGLMVNSIYNWSGKYFGGSVSEGNEMRMGNADEKKEKTKLRNVFMESLMFIPELIVKDGKAQMKIPLADNITSWKMQLMGNSQDGYLGSNSKSIKVFVDFFINFELPANLMIGDTVRIPVTVYNYLPQKQDVVLTVANQPWFSLLDGHESRSIAIEMNSQKLIYIPIKVNKAGSFKFRVDGKSSQGSDAVEKDMKINPSGFHMENISTFGSLNGESKNKVLFMDKDMEGTRKIKIKLFPSKISRAIDGLEGLISQPHGCFEQISSSLYPDILVLKHLKSQKTSNSAFESKAREFIRTGFQQILTYEANGQSGGFSLFRDGPGETVLTAYGFMEFSELKEVYPVDDNLLKRMKDFLISKQKSDGSFEITGFHEGSAGNTSAAALNSYIGWALSEVLNDDKDFDKTIVYLKNIAKDDKDSYTLSLIANVLANRNDSGAKDLLNRLMGMVVVEGDRAYLKSRSMDYYGSYGVNQDIQATALFSIALSKSGLYDDVNKKLINYILYQKQLNGGFGATQATILSLKAIVESSEAAVLKDGKIIINVNGKEETIEIKKENALNLYQRDFETSLKENDVTLKASNDHLSYEIIKEYYVPFSESKSSNSFEVKRELNSNHFINKDFTEKIKIINSQKTEVKNMMAIINIPQGCSLDYGALDAQKTAKVFEDYNLSEDVLEIYFRNIAPSEMKNIEIKIKPAYPMEVLAGGIRIYDYYNPEKEASLAPMRIVVDK